jgi:hypothetical protein
MYHAGAHGGQPQQIYHGGAWQSGAGHPYASNAELHHAQYSALPVRGGRMREAFAGVGDYGYGGGLHHPGGVSYMHVGPMQPLVPQRIGGGMLVDKHAYEWYEGERGRDLEEREWRRSPRRRSSSSSRSRSPRDRKGRRRRERRGDDESSVEVSDDSEIVARVEGVEEELRALVEDKRDQDAQVQEQISQALTLAQRISSGSAVALLLHCASLVLATRPKLSTCACPLADVETLTESLQDLKPAKDSPKKRRNAANHKVSDFTVTTIH